MTTSLDTANHVICGVTSSLSPFGVFQGSAVDTTPPVIAPLSDLSAPATSSSGAVVSWVATATDLISGNVPVVCDPSSASVFPLGTTVVHCTASDEAGNTSEASFNVVVVDTTPPTLAQPADVTAEATSRAGAQVVYALPAASDVVDPDPAVICSPASGVVFPIGTTTVACTATDDSGNSASTIFTVTIVDVTVPGEMSGAGFVRADDATYHFAFHVRERASDGERGQLLMWTERARQKGKDARGGRGDRFVARTVTFVAFSDDPTDRPGRPRKPNIDTVLFSGVGEWNGQAGYTFEVFAMDNGEPGHQRDSVRITIWDPSGAVVASVDGDLDGGNVQSKRVRH